MSNAILRGKLAVIMKNIKSKPFFITFEGGEGSGKSAQARALYRKLGRLSIPSVLVHEPGSTVLGEKLSRLLKHGGVTAISPLYIRSVLSK